MLNKNEHEYIIKSYKDFFIEASALFEKKDKDYGQHWLDSKFENGVHILVYMEGKVSRLIQLLQSKENPNFESIHDTLIDLANYSNMLDIYLNMKKLKEIINE